MPDPAKLIRLSRDGHEGRGLTPMALDPAAFQSPLPVQHVDYAFVDEAIGLRVGTWDTTTMQEAFGPYPGDEVILVLEGRFEMIHADGLASKAGAGDTVIFRNGAPMSWKQEGYLRKFFLIYNDGKPPAPLAKGEAGLIVLKAGDAPGQGPIWRNASGRLTVSQVAWNAATPTDFASPSHRLVQILSGHAILSEPGQPPLVLGPGEMVFIPAAAEVGLRTDGAATAYVIAVAARTAG